MSELARRVRERRAALGLSQEELARRLCDLNRERQAVEQAICADATAKIEKLRAEERSALVLSSEAWHQGVVGIVASRLSEKYAAPSFMIHLKDGSGKGSCRSYGGWSDGYDVYLQIRWQAIPEERRRAFKEAAESDGVTEIGGIPVKVSSHRVMDQYAPFDSALELKALPCLSELICQRWHPDLLEFLRENPFVDEVTLLNHGQRTLDLRGTSIRKLMLDMTGLEELWLCEGTELLLFQNKGPDACTIHAPEDGSGLTLQFIGEYRPHTELPNLWGLHGIQLKDFDLTGLAAVHPHLKELRLWGAPGNLGNFSAVGGFRELTNLSTFDLFGFGAADIPTPEQMPELRWFWMTSLPETAAKAAKQIWKGKPGMDLRITKPRKPEWLAQNLDNPFRGWDGAEHIPAAAAKKAASQYRKTRSQLVKLAAQSDEDAQAQALDAVAAYTQTFNKMGFIETVERDEIYMALRDILDALPDSTLQKEALIEKFEELRDF